MSTPESAHRKHTPGEIVYIPAIVSPDGKSALINYPKTTPKPGSNPNNFEGAFQVRATTTGVEFALSALIMPVLTAAQIREAELNSPQDS